MIKFWAQFIQKSLTEHKFKTVKICIKYLNMINNSGCCNMFNYTLHCRVVEPGYLSRSWALASVRKLDALTMS